MFQSSFDRVNSMQLTQPKLKTQRLIVVVAILLGASHRVQAQEPYFPDLVFLPKSKEGNSLVVKVTEVHLKAMKEPSLWKLPQADQTINAYRFLWLATGRHPISIRLTQTGGTFALHVAGHDGPPGMRAGKLTTNKDVKLSVQQGEKLIARLQQTKFWTSPVEVKESLGIADGDVIVIEGVEDGKYHVIRRVGSKTGESYKAFCRSLLALADEPVDLNVWDGARQGERMSPGYRSEPPQTEYQGE